MTSSRQFDEECQREIELLHQNGALKSLTRQWFNTANAGRYSYHFRACGLPVIQYPQDMVAVQEIIWSVKPTVIIETGVARGGSLTQSAAMLALIDYCAAAESTGQLDVRAARSKVIGIDIDIRQENEAAIRRHPLAHKIELVRGSSIDADVVSAVVSKLHADDRVLVFLDSNHTHDHVYGELEAYAPLVSRGSYCIVFDTVIDELPPDSFDDRPWKVGNSPKSAVETFFERLRTSPLNGREGEALEFEVDETTEHKLQITVAPGGYLKRK